MEISAFWLDLDAKKELVPYAPQEHKKRAWKFILWEKNDGSFFLLVGALHRDTAIHKKLLEEALATDPEQKGVMLTPPCGAGDMIDGDVTGWVSTGLHVATDFSYWKELAKILRGE